MNNHIVVATAVIGGSGIVNAIVNQQPLTRVIVGSFILMLVLSIADSLGSGMSKISSAIAMLAMIYVLIAEFPWTAIMKSLGMQTT